MNKTMARLYVLTLILYITQTKIIHFLTMLMKNNLHRKKIDVFNKIMNMCGMAIMKKIMDNI